MADEGILPQRTVLIQNVARAVSADVSDDLPVNPLLCILYTLRVQQAAVSDTADKIAGLFDILSAVSRIEVLFRGSTVFSMSLADAAMMSAALTGRVPMIINQGDASNGDRSVTVPIFLGRPGMGGMECFPATRRGEFTLRRLFAASASRVDASDMSEQVETVELLGAMPEWFLKAVTIAKTFVTTGDNDVDLPLGNPILGSLLFGTTGFAAATSLATWKQLRLLVDNVEYMYANANWETLVGEWMVRTAGAGTVQNHVHTENLAAAYAADVASGKPRSSGGTGELYSYLDFDPLNMGSALHTAGRGRVHLRVTAGTADAARCMPLELIKVPAAV